MANFYCNVPTYIGTYKASFFLMGCTMTTAIFKMVSRPEANTTIASYNASVVKIYSATNSMTRF
jgi:hypothetical protein